jgi:tRNA A37 threonylcarbamoyladenosine dehydratase
VRKYNTGRGIKSNFIPDTFFSQPARMGGRKSLPRAANTCSGAGLLLSSSVMTLSQDDLQRYSRQILLPGIGVEGQARLKAAKVLIIGVGGLGCPAALYLAAAGIGRIGLVDDDRVSFSNLQRQILYDTEATGQKKVVEAKERLKALNPSIQIDDYDQSLTRVYSMEPIILRLVT